METTYQASHMGSTFQKNAQSMLVGKRTNILLVKDDVGKAKPSTRKLPSEHMAFGKANRFDESAAQVMDKFQYRDETEKGRYQHPKINDFTRLNKAVLK